MAKSFHCCKQERAFRRPPPLCLLPLPLRRSRPESPLHQTRRPLPPVSPVRSVRADQYERADLRLFAVVFRAEWSTRFSSGISSAFLRSVLAPHSAPRARERIT